MLILSRTDRFDNSGYLWVNELMNESLFLKLQEGRKKYQAERTRKRISYEKQLFDRGVSETNKLTQREFFLVGVALYWAEGFKHPSESTLGLATLDSKMAKFYVNWLIRSLGIMKENLLFRVTANEAYKAKASEMERSWPDFLGVDLSQFRKAFFQKTKQVKIYANSDKYQGVIRIRVRKGLDLLRKMRGWMVGLGDFEAGSW